MRKILSWMGRGVRDPFARWLLIGGFVYAFLFGQGIPLWDDDFTSWFWKIKDESIFRYVWEWISPVSTQPQYWGFNERPVQALVYKFFYLISGYESWSYFLYKDLIYAGMGLMIYLWGLRLTPNNEQGRLASAAAAVFFLLAPGTMAAHVIHSDLATTAEFLFLVMTYFIWSEVEKTPESWTSFPSFKDPEQKAWLKRWALLSVLTYLSYKSKADLKTIPLILAAYLLLQRSRRRQWKVWAFPIGLMLLLAVPWGPGILTKLPPFLPGSKGSEIGWMWQPASASRFLDFLWSSSSYDFLRSFRDAPLSLAGLLGPFLLVAAFGFLIWRMEAIDRVPWRRMDRSVDRARTFALVWLVVILVAVSALPAINMSFRVRYGIITLVPVSLLLAWVFGLFLESSARLPVWVARAGIVILALQAAMNLNRSVAYRQDMGKVMVAVDRVYEHVAKNLPNVKLALMPDFRPYDYRPDAPAAIRDKTWLGSTDDLGRKFKPFETYVISWRPSLWEEVEGVAHFTGCRETTIFDRLFSCPESSGVYLMRYIGRDEQYSKGEEFRRQGKIAEALQQHEQFLARYPQSMAGNFVVGLEAFQLRNFARSEQAYDVLERNFPEHLSIVYNHALGLAELGRHADAIRRMKFILARDPANYATLINLYYSYKKSGKARAARETLVRMKKLFPENREIDRLLATG